MGAVESLYLQSARLFHILALSHGRFTNNRHSSAGGLRRMRQKVCMEITTLEGPGELTPWEKCAWIDLFVRQTQEDLWFTPRMREVSSTTQLVSMKLCVMYLVVHMLNWQTDVV